MQPRIRSRFRTTTLCGIRKNPLVLTALVRSVFPSTQGLRLVALCLSAWALCDTASAVSRCTDAKGKVTFQDAPCDATATSRPVDTTDAFSTRPKAPSLSTAHSNVLPTSPPADTSGSINDYATARGSWRGPVQFQISVGGVRDSAAEVVTPMVIEIRPTGEVVGVIPAAGCKISGLSTTMIAPYIADLNVSMQSCSDPRFNLRFSGRLSAFAPSKETKLNLTALALPVMMVGKIQHASIEAVLKR